MLSFHEKKTSMQLPKNDNSLLTTIKTTSTTIHNLYSSSDDSSMSSVNTCSMQRTEQRIYIDTKFVETFISKSISKQHYEGVQDALLKFVNIVNDNEQEYSILTQKRDKKIDDLKRSIFSICKKYTNKGTKTDTHVTHAHRFLESLKKNAIWNIGFMKPKLITMMNKEKSLIASPPNICLCPCSSYLKQWHRKYLSKQNEWNVPFTSVPCNVSIMSSEDFYLHVKKFKDKDVYHKMIYEIIQHVYLIKK